MDPHHKGTQTNLHSYKWFGHDFHSFSVTQRLTKSASSVAMSRSTWRCCRRRIPQNTRLTSPSSRAQAPNGIGLKQINRNAKHETRRQHTPDRLNEAVLANPEVCWFLGLCMGFLVSLPVSWFLGFFQPPTPNRANGIQRGPMGPKCFEKPRFDFL